MALFSKKPTKEEKIKKQEAKEELKNVEAGETAREELEEGMTSAGSAAFSGTGSSDVHKILRGFYVSEKASIASGFNQYVFRVFKEANKSEVKKEVSKLFNVKVKDVKILNMPEKRRDFGKHPGSRSGFKKAIVVLEEGYTIGQAKP